MNRVKFVPADPRVRVLSPSSMLVYKKHGNGFWLFERGVIRRGWIRLADLPPSERRKYRGVTAAHQ